MSHLMNTYARLPVTFRTDKAVALRTSTVRPIDALSGIAVNTLGHNHPVLVKAIAEQAGRILHVSNLYGIRGTEQLADRLCALRHE